MPLRRFCSAIAAVAIGLAPTTSAIACTTMLLGAPGSTRLAYSYDFDTGAGVLVVNGRGAERRSILDTTPDSWVVRYGSVTFNQFGQGSPTTGMNEAGLVVTLMWNDDVEFPEASGRPAVTELEFIQRLLDTSGSVSEAVAEALSLNVTGMVPIHYFVTDRAGRSAALAFQDGALHVTEGPEIPALTNTDYDVLLARLPTLEGFGGTAPIARSDDISDPMANSVARFAQSAMAMSEVGPAPTDKAAFASLERVENPATRWNVVYDPVGGSVSFRIGVDGPVGSLAFDEVDFTCLAQPLSHPLGAVSPGSIADGLAPLSHAENLALVREVYARFPPTAALPEAAYSEIAAATLASATCSDAE